MSSVQPTAGSGRVVGAVATKSRKRLPRAEREERMLDAAEAAFGRRGFQGVSMDEIARRSGITKALLYQYFGSKEGLCEATVDRGVARLFAALEEATAEVPPGPAQVTAFVQGYFDYIDATRDSFWLLYAEASPSAVNAMRQRNAAAIGDLIANGFEELGRDADADAIAVLAQYLVGAGEQVARWWVDQPDVPKEVVVARFGEAAGAAIAAAFGAAPPVRG
jgi:AcrR family transcriptional regulator